MKPEGVKIIFQIARRYLFSRKSPNIINIITGLSVAGLATGTCVILLVLSVFNGLETTILSFFNKFNPDVRIEAKRGKTFSQPDSLLAEIQGLEGVKGITRSLEEIVLFENKDRQEVGIIKGVSANFRDLSKFDSVVVEGKFLLEVEGQPGLIAGLGIGSGLGLNVLDPFSTANIYALTGEQKIGLTSPQPFRRKTARPTGMFSIQQDYDNEYIFAPLGFVQSLLQKKGQLSALEVTYEDEVDDDQILSDIRALTGGEYTVLNRYEQEKEFLRLMQIEKWLAFVMLGLASLLVAFNMIGALWMIVLDKRKDMSMLQCLGLTKSDLRKIVLTLGAYIAGLGVIFGGLIAVALYQLQIHYGLIGVPESFAVNAYPVEMRWSDALITISIILAIGLLASLPAAGRAHRIPAFYKVE